MIHVDTERKILSYLGAGDLAWEKIKESIATYERTVVWGHSSDQSIREDSSFQKHIDVYHKSLELYSKMH